MKNILYANDRIIGVKIFGFKYEFKNVNNWQINRKMFTPFEFSRHIYNFIPN